MENNIENKIRFFGLYISKHVARMTKHPKYLYSPLKALSDGELDSCHLELKSIEEISDSDMELIFSIEDKKPIKTAVDFLMENLSDYNAFDVSRIIDNIRAKGYAWPYGGLTVRELIDYGWLKLKKDGSN